MGHIWSRQLWWPRPGPGSERYGDTEGHILRTKMGSGLIIVSLLVVLTSSVVEVGSLVTVNIRGGSAGSCTGVLLTRHHVLAPQHCDGGQVSRRTTTRPGSR